MADGQFPETFAALSPRFIAQPPHDVITGKAYNYRRTDDGQFVLSSAGWKKEVDAIWIAAMDYTERLRDWTWEYSDR